MDYYITRDGCCVIPNIRTTTTIYKNGLIEKVQHDNGYEYPNWYSNDEKVSYPTKQNDKENSQVIKYDG